MVTSPREPEARVPLDQQELRSRVRQHIETLAQAVDEKAKNEGFQEVLRNMARFWRYSIFNQFLIRMQKPEATWVTGLRKWEAMGRRLKVREQPLMVFAPSRHADGAVRFLTVPVYDVSQTKGRRLRTIDVTLEGESSRWQALERSAAKLGIEVRYTRLPAGIRGRSFGGRVEILPGLPGQERAAVLAHELAHEVLHQAELKRKADLKRPGPARTHAEVETEAEATSYVVLAVLGLPSKAPEYIAWQRGTGLTVLRSMTRIQRAAKALLEVAGTEEDGWRG